MLGLTRTSRPTSTSTTAPKSGKHTSSTAKLTPSTPKPEPRGMKIRWVGALETRGLRARRRGTQCSECPRRFRITFTALPPKTRTSTYPLNPAKGKFSPKRARRFDRLAREPKEITPTKTTMFAQNYQIYKIKTGCLSPCTSSTPVPNSKCSPRSENPTLRTQQGFTTQTTTACA